MVLAILNSLDLLTLDLEFMIPEYITPLNLCSSLICSETVEEAFTPLLINIALKSSLILFDSTPLPKQIALYQFKVWFIPCSLIGIAFSVS